MSDNKMQVMERIFAMNVDKDTQTALVNAVMTQGLYVWQGETITILSVGSNPNETIYVTKSSAGTIVEYEFKLVLKDGKDKAERIYCGKYKDLNPTTGNYTTRTYENGKCIYYEQRLSKTFYIEHYDLDGKKIKSVVQNFDSIPKVESLNADELNFATFKTALPSDITYRCRLGYEYVELSKVSGYSSKNNLITEYLQNLCKVCDGYKLTQNRYLSWEK